MMPHPSSALPALEEGLLPLNALDGGKLPGDMPFSRLRALLSLALERASQQCAAACLQSGASQDERRALSLISRCIARQEASLAALLPLEQTPEEREMDLALLSLELAAALAQPMRSGAVRAMLDHSLPQYLDALYRVANLLCLRGFPPAGQLIGAYAEIMPGRPLIACHRHPFDGIGKKQEKASLWEEGALLLMAAQEEYGRQHLLSAAAESQDALTRSFFLELSLLRQQQFFSFSSLQPSQPPLRRLLAHRYAAAFLYGAFLPREADHALAQCGKLCALIEKSGQTPPALPPFPPALEWGLHKGYVRDALQGIGVTALREGWSPVGALPRGADYFRYQRRICPEEANTPSCQVIEKTIAQYGTDCRFEIAPHPIEALRDRTKDHPQLGR